MTRVDRVEGLIDLIAHGSDDDIDMGFRFYLEAHENEEDFE